MNWRGKNAPSRLPLPPECSPSASVRLISAVLVTEANGPYLGFTLPETSLNLKSLTIFSFLNVFPTWFPFKVMSSHVACAANDWLFRDTEASYLVSIWDCSVRPSSSPTRGIKACVQLNFKSPSSSGQSFFPYSTLSGIF